MLRLKIYLNQKQGCIPVGCVSSAAVAVCWGWGLPGGVCPERGVSARGEGVFAWEGGVSAQRGCLPSACQDKHPPVNRMTDRQV